MVFEPLIIHLADRFKADRKRFEAGTRQAARVAAGFKGIAAV